VLSGDATKTKVIVLYAITLTNTYLVKARFGIVYVTDTDQDTPPMLVFEL
jgi:hypothetical protein